MAVADRTIIESRKGETFVRNARNNIFKDANIVLHLDASAIECSIRECNYPVFGGYCVEPIVITVGFAIFIKLSSILCIVATTIIPRAPARVALKPLVEVVQAVIKDIRNEVNKLR